METGGTAGGSWPTAVPGGGVGYGSWNGSSAGGAGLRGPKLATAGRMSDGRPRIRSSRELKIDFMHFL